MMPWARQWEPVIGIPAAVLVAIGASETNYGEAGGFFGIKGSSPSGNSRSYRTWEVVDGVEVPIDDEFAVYTSPDEAIQHFVGLVSQGRYRSAWERFQSTGDWKGFLQGLNEAGYATDPIWYSKIANLATNINGGTMPEGSSGDNLAAQAIREWKEAERKWREYQRANKAYTDADGNVFKIGPDGKPKLDTQGRQVYQEYTTSRQRVDDAIAIRDALGTGADAAKAFQDSEILKTKEADRAYKDWQTRIQDLAKLEAVPGAQAEAAQKVRQASEKMANERAMAARSGIALPLSGVSIAGYSKTPGEVKADLYSQQADSLRPTIPAEAPSYAPLSNAAMAPLPTGIGGSIVLRPEDVITTGSPDSKSEGMAPLGLPELDDQEQARAAPPAPTTRYVQPQAPAQEGFSLSKYLTDPDYFKDYESARRSKGKERDKEMRKRVKNLLSGAATLPGDLLDRYAGVE